MIIEIRVDEIDDDGDDNCELYDNDQRKARRAQRIEQAKNKDRRRRDIITTYNSHGYNPCVGYIDDGEHIKYPRDSDSQGRLKKLSNKRVRRYGDEIPNGNAYRKLFDYWWELL